MIFRQHHPRLRGWCCEEGGAGNQLKILRGYLKGVDTFNEWAAKGFAWLIVILVVGMAYSAIKRYGFGSAPLWTYDFTYYLYAAFFMMGAAYTFRLKGHVRVDVLYRMLSPRAQGIVDMFFSLVAFFPLMIALLYVSMDSVLFSWRVGERAVESVIRVPIYPLKTLIPVVALMLLFQGVAEFIRDLFLVITRRELKWK